MPTTLAASELQRLARLGAIARLKEIEEEATAIRRAFPGLGGGAKPATASRRTPARRKRQVSPEAREAARKRMQDYWARKKSGAAAAAPGADEAAQASERAPARTRKPRKTRKGRAKKAR